MGWFTDDPLVTADSDYTADGGYAPQFPNVPPLPGVPSLPRLPGSLLAVGGLALADGTLSGAGAAQVLASQLGFAHALDFGVRLFASLELDSLTAGPLPQYAILDANHNAVLTPDSVVEVDVQADSGVMTHPIEQGAFAAYNRVQEPIGIRLMLACQGKNMARAAFLAALTSLREGTTLVTIATPDDTYRNMALKGFGYRKSAERGAITLWADTTWIEGRSTGVTVSAPASSQPYGAGTSSLGSLQLQTLTPQQLASVGNPTVVPAQLPPIAVADAPPSGDAF